MSNCIDLMAMFGERYRITHDPARHPRERLDPWLMQIRGRYGVIYPHGGDKLACEVDYHPKYAAKVQRSPGVVQTQDGTDEKTFVFPVELFDKVAEVVLPYRKPSCTAEDLARRTERIKLARANRHPGPKFDNQVV
jgi:hypothetical protein